MIQKFLLGLFFLFSLGAMANVQIQGPDDGAVTPWPLEVGRQPIEVSSFEGRWVSLSAEGDPWVLSIRSVQDGSYHWELFLQSSPGLRSEGVVHYRDDYVIGLMQAPFLEKEFVLMYLREGRLNLKIGGAPSPRAEVTFVRVRSEI